MKRHFSTYTALLICFLVFSMAVGCTLRPLEPSPEASPIPSATPEPTPVPEYTVTFRAGQEILAEHALSVGSIPEVPAYESSDYRIVGWVDESGTAVIPDRIPVEQHVVYSALLRPALNNRARFVYADIYGLFHPEDIWTRADAAQALYALVSREKGEKTELPDMTPEDVRYEACSWFAAMGYAELTDFNGDGTAEFGPDEPMTSDSFAALLTEFFAPAAVETVTQNIPSEESGLTRSLASQWLFSLLELDAEAIGEAPYYPDVSPAHEAYNVISRVGAFTGYTAEDFSSKTLDGFLWFDGYLYAWDTESGYFHADVTLDTLYYGKDGRYTCGDPEVDGYVAALIKKRCNETTDRRSMLETMHKFLRDENMYLVRNRYEAGATGWEIEEARIMLSTGKGNCYSFAGAFWALGRGLGYNTVSYSGTISKNYDPHGWTEVILDGVPYICDPEIQKQYWASQLYYDTFMLPYEMATGWQYEAPNRTN